MSVREPQIDKLDQSEPSGDVWISKSVPYEDMPGIRQELLAGESRGQIAARYGCSPQWISECTVTYLRLIGEPDVPRGSRAGRKASAKPKDDAGTRSGCASATRTGPGMKASKEALAEREAALARTPPSRPMGDGSCT